MVEYEYDVWGKSIGAIPEIGIGAFNPFRYRGYVWDVETNLYYVEDRYYNSKLNRLINADDVDELGSNGDFISLNLTVYCGNNPVARADSNGRFWHLVVGGIVGAISAISSAQDGMDIVISAIGGAVGGVLAASGAGAVAQAVGNAVTSMTTNAATQLNDMFREDSTKESFSVSEMLIEGAVGLVSGIWGGKGASYGNSKSIMSSGRKLFKKGFLNPKARRYYAKVAHNMDGEYVFKPLMKSLGKTAIVSFVSYRIKHFMARRKKTCMTI